MITVSYSELDTFRQCPFKWKLGYAERWVAPPSGNNALAKGGLYHEVMQAHFEAIKAAQVDDASGLMRWECEIEDVKLSAIEAAQRVVDNARETNSYPEETIQLVVWMYIGYVEKYGIDEEWKILAVESTHIIPLFEPDGTESTEFNLKIKVDLTVLDQRDRMWIVDHKSASRIPKLDKDFQFEDQFGLYEFGFRQLKYKIAGTIHNANTTKQNKGDIIKPGDPEFKSTMKAQSLDDRMRRTLMTRTDAELINIQATALADAKLMYSEANAGQRRPNSDTCQWRCSFTEACLIGRRQGESATRIYLQDTGFTQEFRRH